MSNGQYPCAPEDLWPLVSWQTRPQSLVQSNSGSLVLLGRFCRKPGTEGTKASRATPHRWAPTRWSAAGAALCLNSISTKKKKKKSLFLWQPSLCLLGCWRGARPQRRVFGFAASSQATVPIWLCSKLLTFNGLTGLR